MKQPLEKHTLRLRPGDVEYLRTRFPRVPVNRTIRFIISREVDRLDAPITDEELEELMDDE